MRFHWLTFALQIVNFAVLVWLLQRFLYRPLLGLIDARQAEVQRQYDEADAAKAEAQKLLDASKADREAIAAEREQVLKVAVKQADEMVKARHDKAAADADAMLVEGRKTLAGEREIALAEARRVAVDLGADLARRLLGEMPMQLRAEGWLERIEQHLAGLSKDQLGGLLGQLTDGAELNVVTASPLPAEVAESWRARLRRPLGDHITITFASDPDLVAGAELHFPTAILSFSLRSELAAFRSEIGARQRRREPRDGDAQR